MPFAPSSFLFLGAPSSVLAPSSFKQVATRKSRLPHHFGPHVLLSLTSSCFRFPCTTISRLPLVKPPSFSDGLTEPSFDTGPTESRRQQPPAPGVSAENSEMDLRPSCVFGGPEHMARFLKDFIRCTLAAQCCRRYSRRIFVRWKCRIGF